MKKKKQQKKTQSRDIELGQGRSDDEDEARRQLGHKINSLDALGNRCLHGTEGREAWHNEAP